MNEQKTNPEAQCPKLRKCMDEMQEITRKYDVAAAMIIVGPNNVEFDMNIPTWSVVYLCDEEQKILPSGAHVTASAGFRIKTKGASWDNISASIGWVAAIKQVSEMWAQQLTNVLHVAKKNGLQYRDPNPFIPKGS